MIVERIADIRVGPWAENFWKLFEDHVWAADFLVRRDRPPTRDCGLPISCREVKRLWVLMEVIRKQGYSPMLGDEIMVRYPEGLVHNGSHRASVLRALDMPVPALLVDNWKNNRIRGKVRWQLQGN